MSILLNTIALLLGVATLLPLSQRRVWWIRAMDFPRLQICVLCVLWLLVLVLVLNRQDVSDVTMVMAIAVVFIFVYQLHWILPYTQLNAVEVENYHSAGSAKPQSISILSCNVLMDNRNTEKLLALINSHKPDILILLESDQWWQDEIEKSTNFAHQLRCPMDNYYGMHVYSDLNMHQSSIDFLVEPDKPSMRFQIALSDADPIQIHVMHPAPPSPTENAESTERDVELISLAKAIADSDAVTRIPTIVAGDLNDVAWSATTRLFRQISGLLDPRVGRGPYNTFNAFHWPIRWPLDHVFVSPHFTLLEMKRLPAIGSDHFPLFVNLARQTISEKYNQVADEPVDNELEEQILSSDVAENSTIPESAKQD